MKYINVTGINDSIPSSVNTHCIAAVIPAANLKGQPPGTGCGILLPSGDILGVKESKEQVIQLIEAVDRS